MERRSVLAWAAGSAALVGADFSSGATNPPDPVLAQAPAGHEGHQHDHSTMKTAPSGAERPRFDALARIHQECVQTAQACIVHCQDLLAQGDKSLAECLRTALDTEVVCATVVKLAGLRSGFTPSQARQSIAVMEACVKACKEHVGHHVPCKECHDACIKAIEASRAA